MPTPGDRVVFEGIKVGGGRREGELVSIDGRAVRVRWPDGSESLLFPGPGAMSVVGVRPDRPRGTGGSRPAGASGTIRDSAKRGSSKRTTSAGGDFREEKKPGAGRAGVKKRTARTSPAVERAVVRTVGTKQNIKKKTLGRAAKKKR